MATGNHKQNVLLPSEISMYFAGIAGGSASGKTTFIQRLTEVFGPQELCVVSQDHYYKPASEQQRDEEGMINFDLPEGIDFDRLYRDLKRLKQGKRVELIEYTFNNPAKFPTTVILEPAPVIMIEGLFIYTHTRISKMLQLKMYIDAREEVKLNRRLKRDVQERGMEKDTVLYQWNRHVVPAYKRYLLPYRDQVDLVIVNNEHFENSLSMVINHIKQIIAS